MHEITEKTCKQKPYLYYVDTTVKSYIFMNWLGLGKVDKGTLGKILSYGSFILTFILLFVLTDMHRVDADIPFLKMAQKTVDVVAIIISILMYPVYMIFCVYFSGGVRNSFFELARTSSYVLVSMSLLNLLAYGIGAIGDDVLTLITNSPEEAILAIIISVLVSYVLRVSYRITYKSMSALGAKPSMKVSDHSDEITIMGGVKKAKRSKAEIYCTAVHEIGHLLPYAAYAKIYTLPKHFEVVVKHEISDDDCTSGYVSGLTLYHSTKEIDEWSMLAYLGGRDAEVWKFGDGGEGAGTDMACWEQVASRYLKRYAEQLGLYYYRNPSNLIEVEYNTKVKRDIQAAQSKKLVELYEANNELFNELVDRLVKSGRFNQKEVMTALGRVVIPSSFPMPVDESVADGF